MAEEPLSAGDLQSTRALLERLKTNVYWLDGVGWEGATADIDRVVQLTERALAAAEEPPCEVCGESWPCPG